LIACAGIGRLWQESGKAHKTFGILVDGCITNQDKEHIGKRTDGRLMSIKNCERYEIFT
jgi:hypothetical protein